MGETAVKAAGPVEVPSAADLRAAIGRSGLLKYKIASVAGMNPSSFGEILWGRRPLKPEFARRVMAAIAQLERKA